MARVASCPKCDHELVVPGEADGETWAKCPQCSAFFQIKEATSRDVPSIVMVNDTEAATVAPTGADSLGDEIGLDASVENTLKETSPTVNVFEPADEQLGLTDADDIELENTAQPTKSGDELEKAAQRIDEWFRSAKTVPDVPPMPVDDGTPKFDLSGGSADLDELASLTANESKAIDRSVPADILEQDIDLGADEPIDINFDDDFAPAPSARASATVDFDADRADELSNLADFDLDLSEPDDPKPVKAAWDDSARMKDLLNDIEVPSEDEFVAAVTRKDDELDVEPPANVEERPSINMFDDDKPEVVASAGAKPRRQRSMARSMFLVVASSIFGLVAGYFALLWIFGPSRDFLNVAQYLPPATLPASFNQPKPYVPTTPPTVVDTEAEQPAVGAVAENEAPPEEPQELAPTTDDATHITATETPAESATEAPGGSLAEMQADYTETDGANADDIAQTSAVGDRYSQANQSAAPTTEDAAATDVTVEKLEATDEPLQELISTDTAVEPATESTPAANDIPSTEPTAIEAPAADPIFGERETVEGAEVAAPVKIAGAPTFTSQDLRASLAAATTAQPQLVAGNFSDGREVQKAKGFAFSMLADLAQKSTFTDPADRAAQATQQEVEELFRNTLSDAHTRGEVAQILPKWIASPNRKHGGVFFGGSVTSQQQAGSVIESTVELDGGQKVTVLTPAGATAGVDTSKPMAVVGWIIDSPNSKVEGYTGTAEQAVWTGKLIPLK